MKFTFARLTENPANELAHGVTVTELGLVEARLVIEQLGYDPCHADNGVFSWYGVVSAVSEDGFDTSFSRPFTLAIDPHGRATVAMVRTTLGRLFDRAVSALIPDDLIIAIPA